VTVENEFLSLRINLKHHTKKDAKDKGYVTITALLVNHSSQKNDEKKPAERKSSPRDPEQPATKQTPREEAAKPSQPENTKAEDKLSEPIQPVIPKKPPSGRPSVKAAPKAPDPPMIFNLVSIEVKDLKNMESLPFDKNDVYAKISYGNIWKLRCPTQEGAGARAIWNYSNQESGKFNLTSKDFMETLIVVEAYDENQMKKDSLIGEAESSFPFDWMIAATSSDSQVLKDMTIPLMNNKVTTGQVVLQFMVGKEGANPPVAQVLKAEPPEQSTASTEAVEKADNKPVQTPSRPPSRQPSPRASVPVKEPKSEIKKDETLPLFTTGICKIKKISCQNLPNVEGLGGKNDPYLTINFGSQSFTTDSVDEAGANVIFDYLDYKLNVDRDNIEFQPLKIVVSDKNNMFADKVIGEAVVPSLLFMLPKVNKGEIEVPVELTDSKKKPSTGKIILVLELISQDKEADKKNLSKIQEQLKKFNMGELKILRIRMFDVPKMHDQSVRLKLNFGEWKYESTILDLDKVPSALFDNLDIGIPTNGAGLSNNIMNGEVFFKTMMGMSESLICAGSCSMQESIGTVNKEVEITMNLVQKGANAGRLVFFVQLLDETALAALAEQKKSAIVKLDPKFFEGDLRITSITLNGLKNKELIGKQVKVSFYARFYN
jgi:cell division protein FtsN